MDRWENETFICLDCETTGLDAERDQIIEIAVAKFSFREILEEVQSLIDPNCTIPESSIEVHKITQQMVQGKPTIREVLPQILKLIGNHIIVGHGIEFDIKILSKAAETHSIPCNLHQNRFIDTLRMARHYGESPVNSLEYLRKHFDIQFEGPHRAMSDVIVNMEVFKRLAKEYRSLKHLFEILAKPVLLKVMPLGPHKGRLLKEVPIEYLLWAARKKNFDQDLLYSIRTEINHRKKGNRFAQASNPFSGINLH